MTKYAVILNRIVEADSANEAIQIFTETHDYNNIECFEYGNEPHPFDGDVTCQDLVVSNSTKTAKHLNERHAEPHYQGLSRVRVLSLVGECQQ